MIRSLEFELRTLRERNQRFASVGGRMVLAEREKEQRQTTAGLLRQYVGAPPPRHLFPSIDKPGFTLPNRITVTLTRMAPGTLDDDGPPDALKNVRDGVADWLGIDDSKRGGVEWLYRQEQTAKGVFRVRVEVLDATKGDDVRKVLAGEAEHRAGALQRVRPKKAKGQALLPSKASFAVLPWEQLPCQWCDGDGRAGDGENGHRPPGPPGSCLDCNGTGRKGRRLAPLARFSRTDDPPARIEMPVPAEHQARYGLRLTLCRRPARFKATGEIWLYEPEPRTTT